jgi:hypothetical protein
MSTDNSRKHLFISHHHKDDGEVTKFTDLIAGKGYDVRNSSIRVKPENQRRLDQNRVSEETIRRLLRIKISWASTVVVLIGKETASRPWVNWEIEQANKQGKRIVGVFARGGTEADIPKSFEDYGSALVNWNSDSILDALDGANNFTTPTGTSRNNVHSSATHNC